MMRPLTVKQWLIVASLWLVSFMAIALVCVDCADARPVLTPEMADREARATLQYMVDADYDGQTAGATPSGFELDPCDVGHRRAVCDFTMSFDDGDACDGEVTVRVSRRGRLVPGVELLVCDSDYTG